MAAIFTTVGNILLAPVAAAEAAHAVVLFVAVVVVVVVVPVVLDTVFGRVVVLVADDDNKDGILAGGLVGVYNFGNTGSGRHVDENEDFPSEAGVELVVTLGIR